MGFNMGSERGGGRREVGYDMGSERDGEDGCDTRLDMGPPSLAEFETQSQDFRVRGGGKCLQGYSGNKHSLLQIQ